VTVERQNADKNHTNERARLTAPNLLQIATVFLFIDHPVYV